MKRVTMDDVAREVGVSRMTVSYAFRDAPGVSAETKMRIIDAAKRLGYRRDVIASLLASNRTNTVGLSLLDLSFEINAEILYGLRDAAKRDGRRVFISAGEMERRDEPERLEDLLDVRADAVVLAGSLLPDAALLKYADRVPLVVVTRRVQGVDSIAVDDHKGACLAVEHLVELGHRRIAHISSPAWYPYTARRDGYVDAMKAAGLSPRVLEAEFGQTPGAAAAALLLDSAEPPTAIFCQDQAALGVRDLCASRGLHVPHDLSIVGFDDTHAASLPGIDLTSVTQQARLMGELAAHRIERKLRNPALPTEQTLLEPSLIVRGSVVAPNN